MIKCPNCGYNCDDNYAFCAMCGTKLNNNGAEDDKIDKEVLSDSNEAILENIDQFSESNNTADFKKNFNFNKSYIDSKLISFVVILLSISLIMAFSLYVVIKKQESKKLQMRFNNMISNPALIPELKEPGSFLELKSNLKANEDFLSLYLKHSNDSQERKEQIFVSYLIEMSKLPHITNENVAIDDLSACSSLKTSNKVSKCAKNITKDFKDVGVMALSEHNIIYLYPDYKFIYKKYSKYLSKQMVEYLKLKAKYNTPVRVGLTIQVSPRKIADKIYDFEKLYSEISDTYIRDEVLKTIYYDFRTFIFTPSIYATTTQEMKKEFKNAYNYFIAMRKKSQLRPLVMSYMDKMRSYNETNFQNDYPYKMYSDSFDDNVEHSALGDIYVQLRKNLFSDNSQAIFTHIYNISTASWYEYDKSAKLNESDYVFSAPDANNNISIYNNTFSLIQGLNIPRYSKLFVSNKSLYLYDYDKLSLSKISFNGRLFSLQKLNPSDATSAFPGVHVINIDLYQNYNIYLEKDNEKEDYIILSKYAQGFEGYKMTLLSGSAAFNYNANVFSVRTNNDAEISFHHSSVNPKETSDNSPTYRIIIHTRGYSQQQVPAYDERTANEQQEQAHTPTIMPKIINNKEQGGEIDDNTAPLSIPPKQSIEPPSED